MKKMKHLKRFNEELNIQTYRRAVDRLTDIGHRKRAAAIKDWVGVKQKEAEERAKADEFNHWKDFVTKFSPFGKLKFEITDGSKVKSFEPITDDFYGAIVFEKDNFEDVIEDTLSYQRDLSEENKNKVNNFWLSFFMVALPTTEESYNKYQSIPPIKESMYRGGIFGLWINFKVQIEGDEISVPTFDIYADDGQSTRLSIADRSTAGKIKNLLLGIFKGTIDYPVKYPVDGYPTNMHDFLETIVCNKSGLTSDYGLNMDHFVEAIQKVSANSLFRQS